MDKWRPEYHPNLTSPDQTKSASSQMPPQTLVLTSVPTTGTALYLNSNDLERTITLQQSQRVQGSEYHFKPSSRESFVNDQLNCELKMNLIDQNSRSCHDSLTHSASKRTCVKTSISCLCLPVYLHPIPIHLLLQHPGEKDTHLIGHHRRQSRKNKRQTMRNQTELSFPSFTHREGQRELQ